MSTTRHLIDFRELESTVAGEGLEGLARRLGQSLNLNPYTTGRGTDQGKDLLFTEIHRGPLSSPTIKWLVSCKDFADSGKSVNENDLPKNLELKLKQHDATGYLLVTTTTISTGAKALLDGIDVQAGKSYYTKVWDETELRTLLLQPENEDILKQFLPKSYSRVLSMGTLRGTLEVFRNEIPSQLYETLSRLIAPFNDKSIYGNTVWPQDAATAKLIDEVMHGLFVRQNTDAARISSEALPVDALVALLNALSLKHQHKAYSLAFDIVVEAQNLDIARNAAQFLFDAFEIDDEDFYQILVKLDVQDNRNIFERYLYEFVCDSILNLDPHSRVQIHLNDLPGYASLNSVYVRDFRSIVESDASGTVIRFEGSVDLEVELSIDADESAVSMHSFPGYFVVTLDETGFELESASADTSSWPE